jgi:hypothetical protein
LHVHPDGHVYVDPAAHEFIDEALRRKRLAKAGD